MRYIILDIKDKTISYKDTLYLKDSSINEGYSECYTDKLATDFWHDAESLIADLKKTEGIDANRANMQKAQAMREILEYFDEMRATKTEDSAMRACYKHIETLEG